MKTKLRGALAPVLTPFLADLEPDARRFIAHCRWLTANGAGLAIFGTNSEAASLSVPERLRLADALLEAGIPASKLMPGTGACSFKEAVELSRHASRAGAAGLLVLPPFYFKGVGDDGLFAYYSEIIERVGEGCAPLYLYHIPQVSGVPISLGLIERLMKRYPAVIGGAKDSSGDWNNARAMIENFASAGFDVFPASESFISAAMPIGGAGCISATVNMNPAGIHRLYEAWNGPQGTELQARADVIRKIFAAGGYNMIAAMKHAVARYSKHAAWATVRPPLAALTQADGASLDGQLDAAGFAMPGYPEG